MRAPDFWRTGGLPAQLLAPLAAFYGLAGRLHRARVTPFRCAVPVVCVGNLVAGGAGKTPVVLALAKALQARGETVHILTRGYGGKTRGPLRVDPAEHDCQAVGDEALLLARAAPTWVARDRPAGARAAVAAGASLVLMDDGFQNPSLAKTASLVVIDGDYGLGNGRLIPAGPLRENPKDALLRAQGIVLLGGGTLPIATDLPVLQAQLLPSPKEQGLAGRRVLAFSGIGRPEKFFDSLRELGAEVFETVAFPDHYTFRKGDIRSILKRAKGLQAIAVTTEKDHVRLEPFLAAKVAVLKVAIEWREPQALAGLLDGLSRHG